MDDLVSRQKVLRCIKESRENIDWGQSEDGNAFLHYSAALYRTIASKECLPSAQKWIPCSERLPNICEDILFSVADLYTAEGCLRDDGDWWQFRWDSIIPKDRVTAWMPLPKPWKGENNERL